MSQIKPAQATLSALRDGQVMNELAQAFHDAATAVKNFGKPAKVTLEITVAPIKGTSQHLAEQPIVMVAEVLTKLPKEESPSTIFFVDVDGNPSRQMETRQQSFVGIGGTVDKETGEINHG